VEQLAHQIRAEQNENGGWVYNSLFAPLNILALLEAGVPMDDPAICRGIQFLRENIFLADEGGSFISFVRADTWDACVGVISYLRIPGHSCLDEEVRPAIEFLLQSQNEDGSFAWASGSRNDPDNDSTALGLRVLSIASETADEPLRSRIRRALRKGMAYLLPRQTKRGGFSVWENTWVKIGPGSHGAIKLCHFDVAHADLTARVLSALAELGLTEDHETVRKGLRFLLNMQCENGAWWCHWWAGYLAGTGYVLEALGRLGLRYGARPSQQDNLLAEADGAMIRAIDFLLTHQNADGGWGETVKADFDIEEAGIGESGPLHTAFVLFNLLACGYPVEAPETRRGYEYLLGTMTSDGRWEDDQAAFTVIPRTLYYRYPLANYVLPLDAMTSYLQACGEELCASGMGQIWD
jgi:squalene-hopene/tetraprenyl-beta-curcumene cyclase